ncbi:uncharacterized protein L203_102116 [Cryptococcus depauperatus CBS 7841]|uniref:ubiquitinyl hydrolase 1 n=1 Tax=Cryptococcus depauperatus CBS 7841 TaxID=1295531 RepID=A0AAJ8M0T5_9TREE
MPGTLRKWVGNRGPTIITNPVQGQGHDQVVDPLSAQYTNERLWGIENFSNTCYCISVLQALYACQPFREFLEAYPDISPPRRPIAPSEPDKKYPDGEWDGSVPGWDPWVRLNKQHKAFSGSEQVTLLSPSGGKEKRNWMGRKTSTMGNDNTIPTLGQLQASNRAERAALPDPFPHLSDPLFVKGTDDQPKLSLFQTLQTLFYHFSHSPPHLPIKGKGETRETEAALVQFDTVEQVQASDSNTESQNDTGTVPNPRPVTSTSATLPAEQRGVSSQGAVLGQPQSQPPMKLASLPHDSTVRESGPWRAGQIGWGVVRPDDFIDTVKSKFEAFNNGQQHDAHEFLGILLNTLSAEIEEKDKQLKQEGRQVLDTKPWAKTFVELLFRGALSNETRCVSCETVSSREETFLDLSIDIESHTSVTQCLRQFSASEILTGKNKFYCDSCCCLQEAEKSMRIKHLPPILTLHLKRFKTWVDENGRWGTTKLLYRVQYPRQLRLPNTTEDSANPDQLYELFAMMIHIGNGLQQGHYVTVKRTPSGQWVMCDDDNIEPISDQDLLYWMGDRPNGAGYVLFYHAVDVTAQSLGLKVDQREPSGAFIPMGEGVISLNGDRKINGDASDVGEKENGLNMSMSLSAGTNHSSSNEPTPAKSPVAMNGVSERQFNLHAKSPSPSQTSNTTTRPELRKEESKKWYRMPSSGVSGKERDRDKVTSHVANSKEETGSSSSRPSTGHTTTSINAPSEYSVPIHNVHVLASSGTGAMPSNMSSSVISSFSAISASTGKSSLPTHPQTSRNLLEATSIVTSNNPTSKSTASFSPSQSPPQPSQSPASPLSSQVSSISILGRKARPTSKGRDHNVPSVFGGSATGSSVAGSSGGSYSGGGGLGRKLSGMGGKLGRSGSIAFEKMGFGKKDGVQEQKK